MSNYKNALDAATEFRKKLGANAANAAACAMLDDVIKKIEEATERTPVEDTSKLREEIEKQRLENYRLDGKVLEKKAIMLEKQAEEYACNIEQKRAFCEIDEIIKRVEEASLAKASTENVSPLSLEIEKQKLENYKMDYQLLCKKSKLAEAQAEEHACNLEQKKAFFDHEIEMRSQRLRTEKERERKAKMEADLLQLEVESRLSSKIGEELEKKKAELLLIEDRIPKAQSALKFLEDKINNRSKELHTKPLKEKGKKDEPLTLTATIGEQVVAHQQEVKSE